MATGMALRALRKRIIPSFSSRIFGSPLNSRSISTLVLAEHEGSSLKIQSLSAVAAAKSLSKDNSISLLLAGSGPGLHEAAAQAASCDPSVSEVLVADSDEFSYPLAEPWAKLVQLVQQKGGYSHVMATSGSFGKNIMPRAAALLDVSPITDVTEISEPHLFVRICRKSRYVKHTAQNLERPDLGSARVVVTGGRALKSAENFKMIEQLAEKLGAAVGATRAAVDAGYVPNDLQVGQTGKIVAPELYMAFGVSGAIQHLAGMRDSKVIVAVNKDADAPIFQVADYGLVGDIFDLLPELLEKLPEKK